LKSKRRDQGSHAKPTANLDRFGRRR